MSTRTAAAPKAAARKAAAKPATRTRPMAPPEPEPDRPAPLVAFNHEPDAPAPEQVLVFELGGRGYYAPADPPAGVLLRYLRILRNEGPGIASVDLIESMCGAAAYAAVAADPKLTTDNIGQLTAALRTLLIGAPADPKA